MNRLVRIEFLKLRTTPAIWITLVLTALLSAVPAAVTILFAGHGENPPLDSVETIASVFAVGAFTSVAMLVMGILIAAGEDRHRTNLATFLGEPRRERVLAAKLLAAGVLGAAVGAFAFGLAAAVADSPPRVQRSARPARRRRRAGPRDGGRQRLLRTARRGPGCADP